MDIFTRKLAFLGSLSIAGILLAVIPIVTPGNIPHKTAEETRNYIPISDPLAYPHVLNQEHSQDESEHAQTVLALFYRGPADRSPRLTPISHTPKTTRMVTTPNVSNTQSVVLAHQALTADQRAYLSAQASGIQPSGLRPQGKLYPQLVGICACESSSEGTKYGMPRQYENGRVLRGYQTPDDVGMCQINEPLYSAMAQSLGHDIYTETGNINFANWLFEQEGPGPWYKSRSCWE